IPFVNESAAAGSDDRRQGPAGQWAAPVVGRYFVDEFALERAEVSLSMRGEYLGDGFSGARGKPLITIDEAPGEASRDGARHGAFAGGHEAREDQFRRHDGPHALRS